MGQHVQPRVTKSGCIYKAEFVGHVVGAYTVELSYGGMAVPGSPFTCNLYDISRVKITESAVSASVGQPVSFAGRIITLTPHFRCFYPHSGWVQLAPTEKHGKEISTGTSLFTQSSLADLLFSFIN